MVNDLEKTNRIKQILNKNRICPIEIYKEKDGAFECALTSGGMNAKGAGLDKIKAQEAAYNNFSQKLSCGFLPDFIPFFQPPDSKSKTAAEILRGGNPNPVTAAIFSALNIDARELAGRNIFEQFGKTPKLKLPRTGNNMAFDCFPYKNASGETEYIPWEHIYMLYGENGLTDSPPENAALTRDCGFLGFSAYHAVIPGITKTRTITPPEITLLSAEAEAKANINRPVDLTPNELKNVAKVLEAWRYRDNENFNSDRYLTAAAIYYALGEHKRAVIWMSNYTAANNHDGFYSCLLGLFQGAAAGQSLEQSTEILKPFFSSEDIKRAVELANPSEIIKKLYGKKETPTLARYKENDPLATVCKIRGILHEAGIDLIDEWIPAGVGGYSLRTTIAGTYLGQNGKGKTPELALASSYAEFIERLCNDMLFPATFHKGMYDDMCVSPEEKLLSASEIFSQGGAFMEYVALSPAFYGVHESRLPERFDEIFTGYKTRFGRDKHHVLPYYSIRDKKIYYIPGELLDITALTNGSCAGNTPHEALTQGLSEVMERYAHRVIYKKRVTPPTIPDSAIQVYPEVWQTVAELRKNKDYEWIFKDASLGEGLPVVLAICVNKKTRTYGVRLGAHPSFGVALERTVTEAFQGKTLEQFSLSCTLDLDNGQHNEPSNYFNTVKTGGGQWPAELFGGTPSYPFKEWNTPPSSNKEMFDWLVNKVLKTSRDVLIRNVSFLGFPVFRVVVPGMSDFFELSEENAKMFGEWQRVAETLRDIGGADEAAINEAVRFIDKRKDYIIEGNMPFASRLLISEKVFPGGEGLANRHFLETARLRKETLAEVYPKRLCPDCEKCADIKFCSMPVAAGIVGKMKELKRTNANSIKWDWL